MDMAGKIYESIFSFIAISVYDEKEFEMNVVVLVGRLARDPEIRYTGNQMAVCTATIAVDKGRDSNGNDRGADFIRLTIFGRQGETFQRYLTKGRQVAVQGRINTGSYVNQKGDTVYTTDVVVDRFDFIGNRNDNQGGGFTGAQNTGFTRPQTNESAGFAPSMPAQSDIPAGFEAIDDDDIPF
jgi:single-strand DNA-binding protein